MIEEVNVKAISLTDKTMELLATLYNIENMAKGLRYKLLGEKPNIEAIDENRECKECEGIRDIITRCDNTAADILKHLDNLLSQI